MATLVGTASKYFTTSSSSLSVTLPTGIQDGDLIISVVAFDAHITTGTVVCSGFTDIGRGQSPTNYLDMHILTRTATSADSGVTYTFALQNGGSAFTAGQGALVLYVFRGASLNGWSFKSNPTATSIPVASISNPGGADYHIVVAADHSSGVFTVTPTGYTKLAEMVTNNCTTGSWYKALSSAGTNSVSVADGASAESVSLAMIVTSTVAPPVAPSSVTPPGRTKAGTTGTASWAASPAPTQQSGIVLDDANVHYEMSYAPDGSSFSIITADTIATSYSFTVPAGANTDMAVVRVRSYVKSGGVNYYSGYTTSAPFSVYNNTPPVAPPSLTAPTAGISLPSLSAVTLTWGQSTDIDTGQTITYDVEFFNGSAWTVIAKSVPDTNRTITHTLPVVGSPVATAQYRVRATDGTDYGSYTTSTAFTITPISGVYTYPSMLNLDGSSTALVIPNRLIPVTGDFTIEFALKMDSTGGTTSYVYGLYAGSTYKMLVTSGSGKLRLQLGDGTLSSYTSVGYKDDTVHYCAIRRTGSLYELFVDGIVQASCTSSIDLTGCDTTYIGEHVSGVYKLKGQIGFPRIWNVSRSQTDISTGMYDLPNTASTKAGYYEELLFDTSTGSVKTKTNGIAATIYGSYGMSYRLVPIGDTVLPNPGVAQDRDNLLYLRNQADTFRQQNGLPKYNWDDVLIIRNVTPIRAEHFNQIDLATKEVYDKLSQTVAVLEVQQQYAAPIPTQVVTQTVTVQQTVNGQTQTVQQTVQVVQANPVQVSAPNYSLNLDLPKRIKNVLQALMNRQYNGTSILFRILK